MPAQQRDARKNYIGIVSDMAAEQRTVAAVAKSNHVVKHLLAAVGAALKRRRQTKVDAAARQVMQSSDL